MKRTGIFMLSCTISENTSFFLHIKCCSIIGASIMFLAVLIVTGCKSNVSTPLMVGVEKADITPPAGFPRYGYPPVMSTGILDPLLAKAMVFKQGDVKGALVVCDLLGIPRDLSRIVREKAAEKTGIPFQNITISSIHSHTSPGITAEFKEYADREASDRLTEEDQKSYFSFLIDGVTEAIVAANANTVEVDIISGIGEAPGISFNRRFLMTDGRVRFNPGRLNSKIVYPAGPADPRVHFAFFRKAGESSFISSLTVFSSHYVRGGTEFSADYPFYLQETYKEFFGDRFFSVFGLGPCGNINTSDPLSKAPVEDSNDKVRDVGRRLAEAVREALPEGKKGKPDLAVASRTIYLPLQDYTEEELKWSKEGKEPLYTESDFLETRRRLKISVWGVQPPLEMMRKYEAVPPSVSGEPWRLPVEIHAFRLDSRTAVVTMPGELFIEFGIDLKKRSPFSNTMLIELANADIAYIPTAQAFKEGGYETVNSRLAPGSGEEMINVALEMLLELKKKVQ